MVGVARPTCSPRSRPASARCGARCTAGPTRRCSRCCETIKDDGSGPQKFVDMAKDKDSGFKLMGFGHRVYKNFDPRAKIIKNAGRQGAGEDEHQRPAARHRQGAWKRWRCRTSYFIERKLYPNVDFYSGIIYRALGIPTNMFTVMFAIGRTAGLDRPLEGDDGGPDDEDLPPAADLHGPPRPTTCRSSSASSRPRGGVARPAANRAEKRALLLGAAASRPGRRARAGGRLRGSPRARRAPPPAAGGGRAGGVAAGGAAGVDVAARRVLVPLGRAVPLVDAARAGRVVADAIELAALVVLPLVDAAVVVRVALDREPASRPRSTSRRRPAGRSSCPSPRGPLALL